MTGTQSRKHRVALASILTAITVVATGCTTIPRTSDPQALRPFEHGNTRPDVLTPRPGREPDLLLRDFLAASAHPSSRHAAARNFMTADAAASWKDNARGVVVLDRADFSSLGNPRDGSVSYTIRGEVVGVIDQGGAFKPDHAEYESTIALTKVDGEWRISHLDNGVVVERTELRNNYEPRDIFFFDPRFRRLVADRRWVYVQPETTDTALLSLLAEGSKELLQPGVRSEFPTNATFTGKKDDAYTFTGLQSLSQEQRHRFAAQVVWTLAHAGVPEPYNITADGVPLVDKQSTVTLSDVAEFAPNATDGVSYPLYAVVDGDLLSIDKSSTTVVASHEAVEGRLQSASVFASTNAVATVYVSGDDDDARSRLYYGSFDAPINQVLEGRSVTRPTFEVDGTALWAVVNGQTIVRIARSTATGEFAQTEVRADKLWDLVRQEHPDAEDPQISVLQLSPSGVQAACIVHGTLYLATVAPTEPGEYEIAAAYKLAPALGDHIISLDWTPEGALIVGTSSLDTPVWRIESDGSAATPFPSGNISAPVVAVAAGSSNYYLTDTHSVLQFPVGGDALFWREVPALQGRRAVPVVAR